MKRMKSNVQKFLALSGLFLCLLLAAGNVVTGVWSADPTARIVEAGKNKKKNKNSRNTNAGSTVRATDSSKNSKTVSSDTGITEEEPALLDEKGSYTTKEDVALYIHQYGKLPQNFITKKEAQQLGWSGGSLEPYAPGKSIGGNTGEMQAAMPGYFKALRRLCEDVQAENPEFEIRL